MNRVRRWLFWISWGYVGVLVLLVSSWSLVPSYAQGRASRATCYWTDALMPYVKCDLAIAQGFLNFPLQLVYAPMFGLIALFDSLAAVPYGLLLLAEAVLLWAPLMYLAWYLLLGREARRAA